MNTLLTIDKDKYLKNENEIKTNQLYEALIYATETTHGLTCDDRKFYFDPINKIFIPIYNDGKSELIWQNQKVNESFKKTKFSENSINGAKNALILINQLDDKKFYKELVEKGFELNFAEYIKIKTKIINNLNFLKDSKKSILSINQKDYFNNVYPFNKDNEIKLIFVNLEKNFFEECDFKLIFCEKIFLDANNFDLYKNFLSQSFDNLKKKNFLSSKKNYLFLSTNKNYSNSDIFFQKLKDNHFIQTEINKDFKISYNDSVKFFKDDENKKINLTLLDQNARVKVYGDLVDNWNFEIDGEEYTKTNNDLVFKKNLDMLTGCLTFIDVEIKNINVSSNFSLCEDSINFIRVKGDINKITVNNSFSDAVDFDFSNIKIKSLEINNAKNDCLDFSFGTYVIENAKILNCRDKGISVGEKSDALINGITIKNTNIGIAAKDSSKVIINNSKIESQICLAAYRKKQEFSGAVIHYDDLTCSDKNYFKQKGSIIKK
jgi:hypothetical protein